MPLSFVGRATLVAVTVWFAFSFSGFAAVETVTVRLPLGLGVRATESGFLLEGISTLDSVLSGLGCECSE